MRRIRDEPAAFMADWLGVDLWEKQVEIAESVRDHRRTAVKSCHGSGKCLGRGTPVMMANGVIKPVEDVAVGDSLMGPDSQSRLVMDVTSGEDELYRIVPCKGEAWVCNGAHQLTLRKGGSLNHPRGPVPNGSIRDISVDTYLRSDQEFKDRWRLFRVPLSFAPADLPVDPYFFGLWLGDGTAHRAGITTSDPPIVDYLHRFADGHGLGITINRNAHKTCPTYFLTNGHGTKNPIHDGLASLGVLRNKHIPNVYLTSGRDQRLALLAGLIDSDGSVDRIGMSLTFKSKCLADSSAYLCRSLGLAAYVSERTVSIRSIGFVGTAHRVSISGDCSVVPVILDRKRCEPRDAEKNHLTVGFTIEPIGRGEYFGFQVDGDGRFLLGDCTVTHNSYLAARIVLWYLHAYPGCIVLTTAPTFSQVENILWRNIRTAASGPRMPLLGKPLTTRYEIAPDWYGLGFKSEDTKPDRFQGFHAENALVVIDEAAGVVDPVYEALDAVMTSEQARMLLIGNPTNPAGTFYDAFHAARSLYHTITIAAADTPNITAGRTVRPYLITQQWIDDAIAKHGADSPYVQSRVNAVFPALGDNMLIPLAWIEAAHERRGPEGTPGEPDGAWEAGLDVARHGSDQSALCIRHGDTIVYETAWSGLDTMETVGRVRTLLAPYPQLTALKVDVIGIGAGVCDRLREERYPVVEINVAAKPRDPEAFASLRHELWWNLRERFQTGGVAGPIDDATMGQLSSIKYRYDSRHTRPVIESKDDAKKRGVKSPDRAEAMMLAFAPPMPGDEPPQIIVYDDYVSISPI